MSGTASEVTWLLSQQRHCWSAVRHKIQRSFHCPTSLLVSCQTEHPAVFSLPNVTAGQLSDTKSSGLFIAQRHCWSAVRHKIQRSFHCPTSLLVSCQTQHPTVFSLPNVTAGQLSDTKFNGLFIAQRHCWSAVRHKIQRSFHCPTSLLVSCQTQHPTVFS